MTDSLLEQLQASLGSAYVLGPELGGGGMSRVFVAEEVALRRSVVVKILTPDLAAGLNLERFKREILLAAALQHPHIVPVLQAGEAAGLPYFTMPLVNGRSLAARLAEDGPLSIGQTVSVLRDVAKALEFAHTHGVVHRDIKPGNILLADNAAVVTDFGIAKALSAARGADRSDTLTQTGTSLGTPAYMAPEQAAADPATDHRADIYAFGVVAYELLTGKTPFAGRSPQKLLAAQMAERPTPVETLRPDTPLALARLIMQCLEKDPATRPQQAADLLRALDDVMTSGAAAARGFAHRGRSPTWTALATYAASFLIVLLAVRIATAEVGLPDWVFPAAVVVMLLGLPVILVTGYVQGVVGRTATRAVANAIAASPPSRVTTLALKASPHVTWRRAAIGGPLAVSGLAIAVGAYMGMRAAGIGPAGSLLGAGTLHPRDRLLVADFRTPGADTSLADVATDAVRTGISESNVVSLLSTTDVAGTLSLMERPPGARLDVPLAREVAARTGAKGVVDGSIAAVGSGYLVNVRLLTPSGNELASFHDAADGPRDLLPTLDKLARRLRAKIGESLKAVHADPPLDQVTTPSLEALRKYAEGKRAISIEGQYAPTIAALREAVRLDTGFAMAYRALSVMLFDTGNWPAAESAATRAYRHRDRLTPRERNLATATYFSASGPGKNRIRAAQAYEAVIALDSTDGSAIQSLAVIEEDERRYASAESLLHRLVKSRPPNAMTLVDLARVQIENGDTIAAQRTAALLQARFPNAAFTPFYVVTRLFDHNQIDSIVMVVTRIRQSPVTDQRMLAQDWLALLALLRGQLASWPRLQAAARDAHGRGQDVEASLDDATTAALIDVVLRRVPRRGVARLDATFSPEALRREPDARSFYLGAAGTYAIAQRVDHARAILAGFRELVTDSVERRIEEPTLHDVMGEIALAEHRPRDALREFALMDTASDGQPSFCEYCYPLAAGRAYDAAGNADSAILMLTRYETLPRADAGIIDEYDAIFRPLMYKRLGELYEESGDQARAIANYEVFIALWKDADPELQPVVMDVRRRVVRLRAARAGKPPTGGRPATI